MNEHDIKTTAKYYHSTYSVLFAHYIGKSPILQHTSDFIGVFTDKII
jgi:hypothetical protein